MAPGKRDRSAPVWSSVFPREPGVDQTEVRKCGVPLTSVCRLPVPPTPPPQPLLTNSSPIVCCLTDSGLTRIHLWQKQIKQYFQNLYLNLVIHKHAQAWRASQGTVLFCFSCIFCAFYHKFTHEDLIISTSFFSTMFFPPRILGESLVSKYVRWLPILFFEVATHSI